MDKSIMLSVIIPVYNTEKYLKRCLDSVILALNYFKYNYELIIINDGSTGNEENIIEPYLNLGKDIKYFKNKNMGLASTKNFGIQKSNGNYLSFIDSDDYIDKEFFNEAFKYITDKCLYDMIIYDWETIDYKNKKSYIVEAKNKKYVDDKWGCIDIPIMPSSCNKIVKKELFDNLVFPNGFIYEDLGTTLILFFKTDKIKYINKPLYKYYLSDSSIMRTSFNEKNLQMLDIFDIIFDRINKLDISIGEKNKLKYMIYTRRLYESILEPLSKESFKRRYFFTKILCNKIKKINYEIKNNPYYSKLISINKKSKKVFYTVLNYCFEKKKVFLLTLLLSEFVYYKFIHIQYRSGVEIENEENN